MAMTRKHFEALALAFRNTEHLAVMHPAAHKLWTELRHEVACVCADNCDRFDYTRFKEACWNKPEDYEGVSDE